MIENFPIIAFALLIAIAGGAIYFFRSRKRPVNNEEEAIDISLLESNVLFYQNLSQDQKVQFELDLRYFLSHTRITGVDTTVSALDRMLIASAAVIPIFYFKEWRYQNLQEVLLYSDAINMDFETTGSAERNILGLVGTGSFEGKLLMSKHALQNGFDNTTDKHNTAIHEFAHLIDKSDGETDGIPNLLLDKTYVLPWLNLMHEQMQKIANGKSDIHPYAYTNKAEFFAVTAEYFFERPELLQKKHPELYEIFKEMFDTPAEIS